MAVFRLPFRWCWSGRQALVVLLLVAAYMMLMVHRPADQPLVTSTSPVIWPLVADTGSAGRSFVISRTTAGRLPDAASHVVGPVPAVARPVSRQSPSPAERPADQPAIRADGPAGEQSDLARENRATDGRRNDGSGGGGGGDPGSGDVGGSDSDSTSDSTSDGTSDSTSGSTGASDSRCIADRVADVSAGRPCAESDRHGPAQRVISYSLFQADGGQPKDGQTDRDGWGWLVKGLDANAALSARLYPGWRVRVYHDTAPGSSRRSRLAAAACRHRHVDLCHIRQTDSGGKGVYRGALWRFFPLSDPLVDVFISRDLDSRLSQREVTAVQHWLATNSTFHMMRDHWDHLITVPGGLWGARPSRRRQLAEKLGRQLDKWLAHPGHKNWDQRALQSVVWFHAAVDSVQHDSYTCQRFPGYTVPFPSRRSEEDTTQYLGQVVRRGQPARAEKLLKCPPDCRPKDHPDWEYC